MALIPIPNGSKFALAKTIATAKAVSDISNASPGVASSDAHGFANNDELLMSTPGWSRTDNSVIRASAIAADTFALTGVNSTNIEHYPAGGGAGSASKIVDWTPISKIPTFETTGGDPKSMTTGYIDYEKDFEAFIGTNPERLNFTVSYDPDSAHYAALVAASESGEITVVRMTLKNGSALYYPGQLFFNKAPVTTKDNEMVNNVSLALQGEITRFAKAV